MSISKLFCNSGQISNIGKIELLHQEPFTAKHIVSDPKYKRICGKFELFSDEVYSCNCLQLPGKRTPYGLFNFSNNCYLNCVLQILLNSPELINFIKTNKKHVSGIEGTFISALYHLYYSYRGVKRHELINHQKDIKKILESLNTDYEGSGMHDPTDVLVTLIRLLHDETIEFVTESGSQQSNILKELFIVNIKTSSVCHKCTYEDSHTREEYIIRCSMGNQKEPFNMLSSIEDFKNENLSCLMCSSNDCSSSSNFVILPKLLFISLDRVPCKKNAEKNRKEIEFNKNLKLKTSHCFENFELTAVICHLGSSTISGHFIIFLR